MKAVFYYRVFHYQPLAEQVQPLHFEAKNHIYHRCFLNKQSPWKNPIIFQQKNSMQRKLKTELQKNNDYFSHFPFITGIIMFYETFFYNRFPLKCNMRLFTFLQIYRRIKRLFERFFSLFFHVFFTLQFYPRYFPVSNLFISLFSFRLQRFRFF